jgi:HSF-type DNA-binding
MIMTSPQIRKVEHNYQDHANDIDIPAVSNAAGMNGSNSSATTTSFVHASDRNFPVKLHFMLNELKSDGLDHIISWQPHGRCFVVHKSGLFVKTILPM